MIDVGIVGFGLAGTVFHAPVIRAVEGLRVAAVVQRHGEPDPALGDAKLVRSVDELLAMENIRLVVIATPNESHAPIARQCLKAGRDVVVDKPFTATLAEAEELVELARTQGRLLTVYQNRRWDGDFKTVRKLVAENRLGRVALFESHFDRFRPEVKGSWKERREPGTGLLFDLGPHLIDQALQLFGIPEAITAELRVEREQAQVEDAFDVTLHYPDVRAFLRAGVLRAAPGPRYWICGTEGTFTKYGLDPQEDALKQGLLPGSPNWGADPESAWGQLTTASGSLAIPTIPADYRGYYENVRDAMLGRGQIAVTPEDALNVMRTLELARQSSEQRRTLRFPG